MAFFKSVITFFIFAFDALNTENVTYTLDELSAVPGYIVLPGRLTKW